MGMLVCWSWVSCSMLDSPWLAHLLNTVKWVWSRWSRNQTLRWRSACSACFRGALGNHHLRRRGKSRRAEGNVEQKCIARKASAPRRQHWSEEDPSELFPTKARSWPGLPAALMMFYWIWAALGLGQGSYLLRATVLGSISSQHQLGKGVGLEGEKRETYCSIHYKDQISIPILLTFIHAWLLPVLVRKQIGWAHDHLQETQEVLNTVRPVVSAESVCTFSVYSKGRVGASTYFSTKTSGFIRVSCSRKAKGNKTQRNTNKDSHYQPFKYTDHTHW